MENYAETRVQLNQVLDLERALARHRRLLNVTDLGHLLTISTKPKPIIL